MLPDIQEGDFPLLSDAARATRLAAFMADHDPAAPVWVFAYGSLMWNPDFTPAETRRGHLAGYYRSFCFWTIRSRGSTDFPGLGLALRHHPQRACQGMVFRLPVASLDADLRVLWAREMLSDLYCPTWVTVATPAGPVRALTFVIDLDHGQYAGDLGIDAKAYVIARAAGSRGSCVDYLRQTHDSLSAHDMGDPYIARLWQAVQREMATMETGKAP